MLKQKLKSGRKPLVKKKKKKTGSKKNESSVKIRKKSLLKQLVVAELQSGVQISNIEVAVKPKIAIHDVRNEVSFSVYK